MPLKDLEARRRYLRAWRLKKFGPRKPRIRLCDLSDRERAKRKKIAYARIQEWRDANPEKVKAYMKKYNQSDKGRAWLTQWRHALRASVIKLYGGCCACCKEKEPKFLAIDHVNGGGSKHIRSFCSPTSYHRWLIKLGRRRAGFRVLCHNCNMARAHWGSCPHGNGI